MDRRKVCVVVTARPSYSRIKSLLEEVSERPELELQLVLGASVLLDRYGNAAQDVERDGFRVDARVFMVLEGENPTTMAKSTGIGLLELATVFDNLRPDVVVTVADRYETIATAIAAAYMNIPLAHVQGGEVTGSIDEKVRHAVTKLADVHFVATKEARRRVLGMGEAEEAVFVTGCPSVDLAARVTPGSELQFDPYAKYGGVGPHPDLSQGYVIGLQHPVTTEYAEARRQVTETLEALKSLDMPALWFWPNVDAGSDGTSKGIRSFRETREPAHMHFFRNMEPTDFLQLLSRARCIVGNSSVGIRECSYLGVPAVNVGSRQHRRERGPNVVDVGHDRREIAEAVGRQTAAPRPVSDVTYGDGHAGRRIAELLSRVRLRCDKQLAY